MSTDRDSHAALDATMSAPGVTPRRSGDVVRAAGTPAGAPAPGDVRFPDDDVLLAPGDTLGRYVIGERVGAGGMGCVFRAKDPDLGRDVAIKVLRTGGEGSGGGLERRLLREAQAMATLSHENLANVYDIGVSGGRVFVAMELVDGGTLRALFADASKGWRDKLAAVVAAGRGLAAAHSAGVIHRDFKPDNVLIARSGRVKVVDFGLARAELDVDPSRPASLPADLSANLTQTGALLGTPAYMAPEQHAGEPVDARADQFAFAVTAWEAVYGRRPFPSDAYASLVAAVRAQEVIPPPRGTGVPPALELVLRRALSREPHARYTSMDALLVAIEHAIHPRRTLRWVLAAAAVALAGGGAVAGWLLTRHDGSSTAAAPTAVAPAVRTPPAPPRAPRVRRTTVKVGGLELGDLAALAESGRGKPDAAVMTRMAQANVVRAHRPEAIRCYDESHLDRTGTIVIEYDLDRTGRVLANRALENNLGDSLASCLLAESRRWVFPADPHGEDRSVRFPFRFAPASAEGEPGDEGGDGVRLELPPMPGLPDGLDVPMPELDVPVPPEPPPAPPPPAQRAP